MENIETRTNLQSFLRQNRDAWKLADKASDDYLLARTGFLNALWSSFEMATQATEKLLKSYLLFADSSLKGSADAVRKAVSSESKSLGRTHEYGHDIEACLSLAGKSGLLLSEDLKRRIERINQYYFQRYPNNERLTSLSIAEVHDLDETVFEIWDTFEKFNEEYVYVCGIMRPVYSELQSRYYGGCNPLTYHSFKLMTKDNNSYSVRKARLEAKIYDRLNSLNLHSL